VAARAFGSAPGALLRHDFFRVLLVVLACLLAHAWIALQFKVNIQFKPPGPAPILWLLRFRDNGGNFPPSAAPGALLAVHAPRTVTARAILKLILWRAFRVAWPSAWRAIRPRGLGTPGALLPHYCVAVVLVVLPRLS
jgi:hypothetical protein